jgi:hypothetical protein
MVSGGVLHRKAMAGQMLASAVITPKKQGFIFMLLMLEVKNDAALAKATQAILRSPCLLSAQCSSILAMPAAYYGDAILNY